MNEWISLACPAIKAFMNVCIEIKGSWIASEFNPPKKKPSINPRYSYSCKAKLAKSAADYIVPTITLYRGDGLEISRNCDEGNDREVKCRKEHRPYTPNLEK